MFKSKRASATVSPFERPQPSNPYPNHLAPPPQATRRVTPPLMQNGTVSGGYQQQGQRPYPSHAPPTERSLSDQSVNSKSEKRRSGLFGFGKKKDEVSAVQHSAA